MPVSPIPTPSPAQTQFVALLREIFQIQNLDLDFGIYRVLNQERRLIDTFLDERLGPLTQEALGTADDTARVALEQEVAALVKTLEDAGVPLESSRKYIEKNAELAALGSSDALETEVYNALCDFFGRYYDAGDFLSRPRYKRDVYALPYNGEEVKLHWANRDQYYIKSAQVLETFEWNCDGQRVRFQLREAGTASDNNKEERRFVLALDENEKPVVHRDEGVLVVEFDFKKVSGGPRDLNADADRRLREWAEGADLVAPLLTPFNGNTEKSQFLHRLNGWAARGSFDFFVHKDLRGFLARELDFYLKNEVVQLDTLLSSDGGTWEKTTLAKARAIHALGSRIIEFLSSLEDLQKRLWEKQKWVTQSRAIVPFALVPAALQADVLANADQIAEWKTLYGVENEAVSTVNPVAWSEPPAPEWAAQHADIAVDTKHFDPAWTRRLWSELSKEHTLDELWNGVLWNADNFAALNLMQRRFKEAIKCVYIDPPYNTGNDFLYKDAYQHSSWLTMMKDRLDLVNVLMHQDATIWANLDDREVANLRVLFELVFGESSFVANVAWEKVYSPRMDAKQFSSSFDHLLVSSKFPEWRPTVIEIEPDLSQFPHTDENGRRYRSDPLRKWGKNSLRTDRPNLWYSIESPTGEEIWPLKPDGTEGCWRWQRSTVEARYAELDWLDKGNGLQPYLRQYADVSTKRPPETIWSYEEAGSTHESQEVLKAMVPKSGFQTPKPHRLVEKIFQTAAINSDIILDYFGGSGTTGHAVLNLNRADGENGQRRYILVEMGKYFDSVLVPRLKKAAFAEKWREGRPADFAARNGVAQSLFVYRLESYEDALEHLAAVVETNGQPALQAPDDDWTVRYAISSATGDGEVPLSDALFTAPFDMQMRVGGNDAGEAQRVTLDAVATFNWLLGLRVHKMWFPSEKLGIVCGLTPDGRAVVVVWRQLKDETFEDADAALLAFWQNDPILAAWRADHDVKTVYINGDSTQWRTATRNESWTCEPLEDTFRSLMFATSPRREGF